MDRIRSLTIYAMFAFLTCACALSTAQAQNEAAPTRNGDTLYIANLDNLAWLQDVNNDTAWTDANDYFKQTANIKADSSNSWNSTSGFSPIGNFTENFTATYDGGGDTISRIWINRISTDYQGMFGFVSGSAVVKNLNLTSETVQARNYIGGLVGELFESASIESCSTAGTVNQTGGQYAGGLVGFNEGGTKIVDCHSTVSVTAGDYSGGLIGFNQGSAITISFCYCTGSVLSNGHDFVGGFVGFNSTLAMISNCYCTGQTIGGKYTGGFVGENYDGAKINNCYGTGRSSGNTYVGGFAGEDTASAMIDSCYSNGIVSASGGSPVGGLVGDTSGAEINSSFWDTQTSGQSSSAGGTGKTTSEMKNSFTFADANWNPSVWNWNDGVNGGYPYLEWQNAGGSPIPTVTVPSGNGSSSPYTISNLANLAWLQEAEHDTAWSKSFKQTADINAASDSTWNTGSGFSPVGNGSVSFTGTYNGNGYNISGLYIQDSAANYVGMFGECDSATLEDISLANENVAGGNWVGGLAGMIRRSATIDSCSSGGSVHGASGYIGGLVGENDSSFVTRSYSTASVSGLTGSASQIGGLAGLNYGTDATISDSYCSGNVNAFSCSQVGGFVGEIEAAVTNCYTTGSVNGGSVVGGFTGTISGSAAVIDDCYSAGGVTGSSNVGGFAAYNAGSASVNGCFWDVTTSAIGSDGSTSGSAGGTGENTTHMQTESTFTNAGWDFASTWGISSGVNNDYPYLRPLTDISLAVQATNFVATSSAGSVTLSWSTQSEVDNAGFVVLRQQISNVGSRIADWNLIASYTTDDSLRGLGTSSTGRSYTFTDNHVVSGGTYQYKIQSVSTNGTMKDLSTLSVTVDVPKTYALYQNYPNPFNPTTAISYQLSAISNVSLKVYDILGREVATLVDGQQNAGAYKVVFDGSKYASGVYFYRITAVGEEGQKFVSVKKLVLIK